MLGLIALLAALQGGASFNRVLAAEATPCEAIAADSPACTAAACECPPTWLISTRSLPCGGDAAAAQSRLRCWRLNAQRGWDPSTRADFLAAPDAQLPTLIFVHGNQTDAAAAVEEGWTVMRTAQRQIGRGSFRMVIWSWPSDRIRGRIRHDVQVKAARSDWDAVLLAGLMSDMPGDPPLCLVGYSFGSRVIAGSLEALVGGRLAGRALGSAPARRQGPVNLVLVAAAIDAGSFCPGCRYGEALSLTNRVLVTINGSDRVLRRYPLLYGRGGPQALGFVGPACCGANPIECVDVACAVGRQHGWANYARASGWTSRLGEFCQPGGYLVEAGNASPDDAALAAADR